MPTHSLDRETDDFEKRECRLGAGGARGKDEVEELNSALEGRARRPDENLPKKPRAVSEMELRKVGLDMAQVGYNLVLASEDEGR